MGILDIIYKHQVPHLVRSKVILEEYRDRVIYIEKKYAHLFKKHHVHMMKDMPRYAAIEIGLVEIMQVRANKEYIYGRLDEGSDIYEHRNPIFNLKKNVKSKSK